MSNPLELITEDRIIELTKTLVSIPSVTGQEDKLADWVHGFFKSLGLSNVQRLAVPESGDSVIGWLEGNPAGPTMMLNFHLDTFDVFAGWETDPFVPVVQNGRLYGLGSHDMKGGAACVLAAVEALVKSGVELNGRLLIAATSDEENWSRGAHALIQTGLLHNCQYCLVPEPSAPNTITVGQRGRHVFQLTFYGKTVHAAYGGGINAVADAAKVVAHLADPATIDLGFNEEFGLTGSFCVIGMEGGGTLILVPELAQVYIDRHILPGQTVAEAAAQIHEAIAQVEIASRYELVWDQRPSPAPPPFLVPTNSHFVQTVQKNLALETQADIHFVLGRSVADTNHFTTHGSVPTLILGPQGGNTCEANEFVFTSSLPIIARTYVRSVLDLLGNT
jgi:succinyl-diaminopimelate desuccinylase